MLNRCKTNLEILYKIEYFGLVFLYGIKIEFLERVILCMYNRYE